MAVTFDILVSGSSLAFEGGFFGISSVVLVRTNRETLLFDCGHGTTRQMLIDALGIRGLVTQDIDRLVISHGHFDHVLNLDLFPNAPITISQDEHDYIQCPSEEDQLTPRFLPELLAKREVTLVRGETEVTDGVVAFPTPGHSPGHMSLALDTGAETVVLAADAVKTAREALSGIPDLEFDPKRRGAASIQAVLNRGDRIVPGHHPVLNKTPDGKLTWTGAQEMPLRIR
ncbi:glyoxylase-like metal-dependent hydrolase (beta-lactamase superfamily II) [Roseibium hamelinense]|uniref:Glyoxylase-like metal-dependent hydrolase (Beta-lactamase superfamily II) n=1 Tax=Roseibium hamelinense TaxID=150831 RepID=A0A562T984_9HYPH|nr:MBL fold metallo-hydrolase [Roseibium hamelinense]MTI45457.1 MBL fold metallo-hydrolase [Roseibium hamelinense]TWI90169.1 glyoxylase-like metal-dependent hydrolase (beta-lactamase superfamily II) [Roseibium hamelinense]